MEGLQFLVEARRLLLEQPSSRASVTRESARKAAQAFDMIDEARQLENLPTNSKSPLSAVSLAVRDLLVLRICLHGYKDRDDFLQRCANAFQRDIVGELQSQLMHSYKVLTSSDCHNVIDAFDSRNVINHRRPRKAKKSKAGETGEHVAVRCAEDIRADNLEPMKIYVPGISVAGSQSSGLSRDPMWLGKLGLDSREGIFSDFGGEDLGAACTGAAALNETI